LEGAPSKILPKAIHLPATTCLSRGLRRFRSSCWAERILLAFTDPFSTTLAISLFVESDSRLFEQGPSASFYISQQRPFFSPSLANFFLCRRLGREGVFFLSARPSNYQPMSGEVGNPPFDLPSFRAGPADPTGPMCPTLPRPFFPPSSTFFFAAQLDRVPLRLFQCTLFPVEAPPVDTYHLAPVVESSLKTVVQTPHLL